MFYLVKAKKLFQTFTKPTYVFSALVTFSAFFNLQILNFLNTFFEGNKVQMLFLFYMFFYFICILILISMIVYIFKLRLSLRQSFVLIFIICFVASQICFQSIFVEKTHVITYGFLGYLAIRDAIKKSASFPRALINAFCFIMLINILDEAFQRLLPYRVGSINDIFLNTLGGITGVLFYIELNRK